MFFRESSPFKKSLVDQAVVVHDSQSKYLKILCIERVLKKNLYEKWTKNNIKLKTDSWQFSFRKKCPRQQNNFS